MYFFLNVELKVIKMSVSFYLLVLLLGIYSKEISLKRGRTICKKIFIATLFKIAKNCK